MYLNIQQGLDQPYLVCLPVLGIHTYIYIYTLHCVVILYKLSTGFLPS
jgi:hypothetical protein